MSLCYNSIHVLDGYKLPAALQEKISKTPCQTFQRVVINNNMLLANHWLRERSSRKCQTRPSQSQKQRQNLV